MARLLVTGGAGFIGANFVHQRLRSEEDDRLVVLDALTYAGNRSSLAGAEEHSGFSFVHGDIGDVDLVGDLLKSESIDTIVHFAAESHVDRSITGPGLFVETNIVGTHALLTAARSCWLLDKRATDSHRFHHVSTDEVYGSLSPTDPAFSETTAFAPNSPYAASKAASDHLVRAYHKTYGLNTCITNCSNNYGPFQFPEKLIPLMLVNVLHSRPLPVYGDGQNVRDWLHVEDHCRAINLALEKGEVGRTYNVGGENEIDNLTLVETLCDLIDDRFDSDPELGVRFPEAAPAKGLRSRELVRFVDDRPGHDRRYAIDPARILRELGFRLEHDLASGIAMTVDWYLANEAWWQRVMDGSYRAEQTGEFDR